jgi:hypothetical protein
MPGATGLLSTVSVEPVPGEGSAPDGTPYADLLVRQEAAPPRTIAGSAEGPAGLFKGLAPALAKAAASSALGFGCYEGVGGALAWAAVPGLALPGGGAE